MFRRIKQLFIFPMSKKTSTVLLGSGDQWEVQTDSLNADSFIVSAGVGHSITFEQDIIARYNTNIILFDPSPTGLKTIDNLSDRKNIEFHPVGLAGKSGDVQFGLPDRAEEGSFRKGTGGDGPSFSCTTLLDVMHTHGRSHIDLLKLDVEGFEYEIIQSVLDDNLDIRQICLEIHHNRVISIEQTIWDAASLIFRLFLRGYRIIYNKNMDFTFVKAA
ncbi:MAG: FkbM family methyltransferase [Formivibrio sp.]|nr:FkbM family methyltransferase [Formivibrio sp.]